MGQRTLKRLKQIDDAAPIYLGIPRQITKKYLHLTLNLRQGFYRNGRLCCQFREQFSLHFRKYRIYIKICLYTRRIFLTSYQIVNTVL